MKAIPGSYTNRKTGAVQAQLELIIWPADPEARDSMKVRFDQNFFSDPKFLPTMQATEGKAVSVPVRIFDFQNGGYVLIANGLPKLQAVAPVTDAERKTA